MGWCEVSYRMCWWECVLDGLMGGSIHDGLV